MFLEIAEHLFDPHSVAVETDSQLAIWQVGSQTPGTYLAFLPVNEQVGGEDFRNGQIASSQPETLARYADEKPEWLPIAIWTEKDPGIAFLAQDIEPTPAFFNCRMTATAPNSQSPTRKTAAPLVTSLGHRPTKRSA